MTAPMAQLIDGKAVAARIREEVKRDSERLKTERGVTPGLAVVRVGEDPGSKVYVAGKQKAAREIGFNAWEHHFPETATQPEVMERLIQLNESPDVHAILVQLPVPKQLDPDALIS